MRVVNHVRISLSVVIHSSPTLLSHLSPAWCWVPPSTGDPAADEPGWVRWVTALNESLRGNGVIPRETPSKSWAGRGGRVGQRAKAFLGCGFPGRTQERGYPGGMASWHPRGVRTLCLVRCGLWKEATGARRGVLKPDCAQDSSGTLEMQEVLTLKG